MKMKLVQCYLSNCVNIANRMERDGLSEPQRNASKRQQASAGEDVIESRATLAFHRPHWTKPGLVPKTLIQNECEHLSGAVLGPKSNSPTDTQSTRAERSTRNSHASPQNNENGTTPSKRRRIMREAGRDELVGRGVIGKMWSTATLWLNYSRHQARSAGTRSFGFIIASKAKAQWEFTCPAIYCQRYKEVPDSLMPTNGENYRAVR